MSNARSFSEQETTVRCEDMIALTQLFLKANNISTRGSHAGVNHYAMSLFRAVVKISTGLI